MHSLIEPLNIQIGQKINLIIFSHQYAICVKDLYLINPINLLSYSQHHFTVPLFKNKQKLIFLCKYKILNFLPNSCISSFSFS